MISVDFGYEWRDLACQWIDFREMLLETADLYLPNVENNPMDWFLPHWFLVNLHKFTVEIMLKHVETDFLSVFMTRLPSGKLT